MPPHSRHSQASPQEVPSAVTSYGQVIEYIEGMHHHCDLPQHSLHRSIANNGYF